MRPRSVEELRADLVETEAAVEAAQVTVNAIERAKHPFAKDMAVVSGIRRKRNPRADARRFAAYDREASAYNRLAEAQRRVEGLQRAIEHAAKTAPVVFTPDELKAAVAVRDRHGWHRVARVNPKSVSVETGYSWVDRIPLDQILEVKTGAAA